MKEDAENTRDSRKKEVGRDSSATVLVSLGVLVILMVGAFFFIQGTDEPARQKTPVAPDAQPESAPGSVRGNVYSGSYLSFRIPRGVSMVQGSSGAASEDVSFELSGSRGAFRALPLLPGERLETEGKKIRLRGRPAWLFDGGRYLVLRRSFRGYAISVSADYLLKNRTETIRAIREIATSVRPAR